MSAGAAQKKEWATYWGRLLDEIEKALEDADRVLGSDGPPPPEDAPLLFEYRLFKSELQLQRDLVRRIKINIDDLIASDCLKQPRREWFYHHYHGVIETTQFLATQLINQ